MRDRVARHFDDTWIPGGLDANSEPNCRRRCSGNTLIGPPLSITAQEIAWAMSMFDEILGELEGRLAAA